MVRKFDLSDTNDVFNESPVNKAKMRKGTEAKEILKTITAGLKEGKGIGVDIKRTILEGDGMDPIQTDDDINVSVIKKEGDTSFEISASSYKKGWMTIQENATSLEEVLNIIAEFLENHFEVKGLKGEIANILSDKTSDHTTKRNTVNSMANLGGTIETSRTDMADSIYKEILEAVDMGKKSFAFLELGCGGGSEAKILAKKVEEGRNNEEIPKEFTINYIATDIKPVVKKEDIAGLELIPVTMDYTNDAAWTVLKNTLEGKGIDEVDCITGTKVLHELGKDNIQKVFFEAGKIIKNGGKISLWVDHLIDDADSFDYKEIYDLKTDEDFQDFKIKQGTNEKETKQGATKFLHARIRYKDLLSGLDGMFATRHFAGEKEIQSYASPFFDSESTKYETSNGDKTGYRLHEAASDLKSKAPEQQQKMRNFMENHLLKDGSPTEIGKMLNAKVSEKGNLEFDLYYCIMNFEKKNTDLKNAKNLAHSV